MELDRWVTAKTTARKTLKTGDAADLSKRSQGEPMDKLIPFSRPRPDAPTAREREILTHIWAGLTSQEIAARLQIAPKTVESHRANLLRKFRATNSAQLLRLALLEGILRMPSANSTDPPQTLADSQSAKETRKLTNVK